MAIPLNAETVIALGLLGEPIDLEVQPYTILDEQKGIHRYAVVAPDGQHVLSSGSLEYAKDFMHSMNLVRQHRLRLEKSDG
jgi:hypothetical protein